MSSIKCPNSDCDNMVSDQALSCPKCGCPVRKVEYKFVTVTYDESGRRYGLEEYNALLKQGWKVVEESENELFADDGHCNAVRYKYKLER